MPVVSGKKYFHKQFIKQIKRILRVNAICPDDQLTDARLKSPIIKTSDVIHDASFKDHITMLAIFKTANIVEQENDKYIYLVTFHFLSEIL